MEDYEDFDRMQEDDTEENFWEDAEVFEDFEDFPNPEDLHYGSLIKGEPTELGIPATTKARLTHFNVAVEVEAGVYIRGYKWRQYFHNN